MTCHTYLNAGSSNLGAPDLSDAGKSSNRGVDGFAEYIADPSKFGNNVMPKFGGPTGLGDENLHALGVFLQSSGTCKPKTDTCPAAGG
jgi:cytochrome c5